MENSHYFPYIASLTINVSHQNCTCVTFSETTLMRLFMQSPFFKLGFTVGGVHSMVFDRSIVT